MEMVNISTERDFVQKN